MNRTIVLQLLLQVILIALNAVFACAEIAVISVNENKLNSLAENGDKRAVRLKRLTGQPARFLATIQVAITLAGFLGSAFAAENFSDALVAWASDIGIPVSASVLDTVSVIIITLILSYFTLVFGELVPKRVAMKNAEALSLKMASMIYFISKLFAPIVWLLTSSTNGILRICGINPDAADSSISEEDIRMLVSEGSQKDIIDSDETKMIQNVFEFDDIAIKEFATHRTEISVLWMDESIDEWEQTIHESRHTRLPVCDKTIDNIVGILNVRDYYRLSDKSHENVMKNAVEPASFTPQSVHADVLFKQMKKSHDYFSVVVDEYGGVVGIVTMNDLLEQIVGDLYDDTDGMDGVPPIEQIDSATWKINENVSLERLSEETGFDITTDEHETLGGLVFDAYGYIPGDGETFETDILSMHVKVVEIKNHKLSKAIVTFKNTVV